MDIETPCKDCVFATYLENTQNGCQLGRIEKFLARGEAREVYDEDKEFYVVNRKCSTNRHKDSPWPAEAKQEDWAAKVRKEIALTLDVIVVFTNHVFEDAERTIESLTKQTLPPHHVWFVINQDLAGPEQRIGPGRLISLLKETNLSWNVNQITLPDRTVEDCVDMVVPNCESYFYAIVPPGLELRPEFISDIDKLINDDLERFTVLFDEPFTVIQTEAHKYVGGNKTMLADNDVPISGVVNKLQYVAKENGMEHMIRLPEEVNV